MWQSSKPPSFSNDTSTLFSKKDDIFQVDHSQLSEKLNEKLSHHINSSSMAMNCIEKSCSNHSAALNNQERFSERLGEKIPPKSRTHTPVFSRRTRPVLRVASSTPNAAATAATNQDEAAVGNNNKNKSTNDRIYSTNATNLHLGDVLVDSLILDEANTTTNTVKSNSKELKRCLINYSS